MFKAVLERFVDESPVTVMARATLENVFVPEELDKLFEDSVERGYTRELLFSDVVELMSLVVCRVNPSVHHATKFSKVKIGVSLKALYDKLNHLELGVSRALVGHSARKIGTLVRTMKGQRTPLLPGYRVRILDGNHLAGTEHRLGVLRSTAAGALPGQALVVLDPELMLIDDVIPCEDGHAQERSLLNQVLTIIERKDLFIDDRNFCTTQFLFGIKRRKAFFLTRQHAQNLYWRTTGKRRFVGRTSTGRVYEQAAILSDPETDEEMTVRRITILLDVPTRDGDMEVHVLTNVPVRSADAKRLAMLYLKRWTLETAFQELTVHLKCELNTLGYPRAALFGFCVALTCYNVMAAVKGAICAAHGEQTVKQDLSNFYLAEEISGVYRGMMIAIPPEEWSGFQTMTVSQMSQFLIKLARHIDMAKFKKNVRGPKKEPPARPNAQFKHVSTAKLLARKQAKAKKSKTKATPPKK